MKTECCEASQSVKEWEHSIIMYMYIHVHNDDIYTCGLSPAHGSSFFI